MGGVHIPGFRGSFTREEADMILNDIRFKEIEGKEFYLDNTPPELIVCASFNCGKHLSLIETLAGKLC